jgi:hypothetical protein
MSYGAEITRIGNNAARYALRSARTYAIEGRLHGWEFDPWRKGSLFGQLLVAKHDLWADPLLVMAVENEIRFLIGRP